MSGSCHLEKASNVETGVELSNTGGLQIVQILCSQVIVLLRNRTKRGLVLSRKNVLLERLFFKKKWQKTVLYWGICTISGIILSGDPLYLLLLSFLTVAEFYNLWHIQGIIRVP